MLNNLNVRESKKYPTLRMTGDSELGPLEENLATLVAKGRPTNVLVGLILAIGDLQKSSKEIFSITSKEFIV